MHKQFELPSELNIYSATEVRDALLAWVAEQETTEQKYLEISARDVSEVDGCGLQLLAALSNMPQRWYLVEASDAFANACRTMGFDRWLDPRYLKSNSGGG